jgi:hypothetical protein
MTRAEGVGRRWSARSLARAGGWGGLAIALVLIVRLILVQTRPDGARLGFASIYGGLLLAPFIVSLGALARGSRRSAIVWTIAGAAAFLLSLTSLAGATLPLLIPAVLLIGAGWRSSIEHAHVKGSA